MSPPAPFPLASAPPALLTLVSATYDDVALTVTLGFNQAVNIDGFAGGVEVEDRVNNRFMTSAGGSLSDASTVVVTLETAGTAPGFGVFMNANDHTGIVAVVGGAEWAGANNLELPYP